MKILNGETEMQPEFYTAEGFMQEGVLNFGLNWKKAEAKTQEDAYMEAEGRRIWSQNPIYVGVKKAGMIWPIT